MNIGLVVNARGKMCLVHDERFEGVPLWVGYHLDKRQIEIIFEGGGAYPIPWEANDEMDHYLQRIDKVLMIRMEEKKPVEGYDTSLLHLRKGKAIELEDEAKDSDERIRLLWDFTHWTFGFAQPAELESIDSVEYDVILGEFHIRRSDGRREFLFAGKREADVVGVTHVCVANLRQTPEFSRAALAGWTKQVTVPLRLTYEGPL